MTLTPEVLPDLRKKAEAARLRPGKPVWSSDVADLYEALPPSVVLALLDRIAALEKRDSEWRRVTSFASPELAEECAR